MSTESKEVGTALNLLRNERRSLVERVAQQEESLAMSEHRLIGSRATLARLNAEIAQIDAALAVLS